MKKNFFINLLITVITTPRFFVYYIPMYNEIAQQTLPENVKTYQGLCAELDLPCFGLHDIVQQIPYPEDYYQSQDGHFSKAGAAVVADHLSTILSTRLLTRNK